ncbi:MAG: hypothetical protein WCP03_02945 [Candidatus Saccharibacteria bacterium]
MNPAIILGIASIVFAALAILFRSNAVYMFLTLCAGTLLADYASKDVTQVVNSAISINVPVYSIVQISLLVIAPLVLLFLYRKRAGMDLFMQTIPAIAFAIVLFMAVPQMLPYDLQNKIISDNIYTIVKPFYSVAIAAGLLSSVFYLWAKRIGGAKHDKKHKK